MAAYRVCFLTYKDLSEISVPSQQDVWGRRNFRFSARPVSCCICEMVQDIKWTLFNGFFSKTTWVSRQKPFWILLEQEMMGWQWHELDHIQIICTSLQRDNHSTTSPLSFYRPDVLPVTQPTATKDWRQKIWTYFQIIIGSHMW